MDKIIEWWNSCNLEFQDKYSILLIQVNNCNKEAKKVMKLINNNPYNNNK